MELSRRLSAIAAMVGSGGRLADIGTDHGYLPIFLVETGASPSAIAMDIKEGPLCRAAAHVAEHGLTDKIEVRKSNGLSALRPGEADTAVIAGMGGLLMIRILKEGRETALSLKRLVLSPQSEIGEVRRYLLGNGFGIFRENMVFDEGKYYVILEAGKAENQGPWSYIEEEYGKYLIESGSPVVREYLEKERRTLEGIREKLKKAGTERAGERLKKVEKQLGMTMEAAGRLGNSGLWPEKEAVHGSKMQQDHGMVQ